MNDEIRSWTTDDEVAFLQGLYHRGQYLTIEKYIDVVKKYRHWPDGVDAAQVLRTAEDLAREARRQFEVML